MRMPWKHEGDEDEEDEEGERKQDGGGGCAAQVAEEACVKFSVGEQGLAPTRECANR